MTTTAESFRVSLSLEKDLTDSPLHARPLIRNSKDIVSAFSDLVHLRREVMIAGAIDCKCRLIHYSLIGVGSCDHLMVRTGDAFHGASKSLATGIFLVHNHPSGSGAPSLDDFKLTEQMAAAGLILGFALFDHVIIASEQCTSLLNPATLQHHGYAVSRCKAADKPGASSVGWTCAHCDTRKTELGLSVELALRRGSCVPLVCSACNAVTWIHENRGGPQTVRARMSNLASVPTLGMVAEQ